VGRRIKAKNRGDIPQQQVMGDVKEEQDENCFHNFFNGCRALCKARAVIHLFGWRAEGGVVAKCRVKLRSGVKYIMKIHYPTKVPGGAHSIYMILKGKTWGYSSGCHTMGKSPGQPATREAGRIHHWRWVRYEPYTKAAIRNIIRLLGNRTEPGPHA
jgi:hypothetical protein